jgi:Domain of unknown function (DUF4440)
MTQRTLILATGLILAAAMMVRVPAVRASADTNPAVRKVDQSFVQAVAKNDSTAIAALLDVDSTWTDVDGNTRTRDEALKDPPAPVLGDESGAAVKEQTYGDVGTIIAARGKIYVLRVWVKRAQRWRLLVYHEVRQLDAPSGVAGTGVATCENPCKTVPFAPKNEAERAIIASWQALETGVTAHDSTAWAPHIADEFVQISSNSDHPIDKAGRMATLDKQKVSGVGSAPSPLVTAQMFDFGDAVVMTCLHQPYKGKTVHVSRVWVKRDGQWVMSISFQTTIQSSTAK